MILTTELSVSNESHSGSGPPQPFNKSKTENHHKTNGCCFLNGFIGMLTMSDSQSDASRAMHQADRYENAADDQSLKDHFEFGVSFCFFLHGFRSVVRTLVRPKPS